MRLRPFKWFLGRKDTFVKKIEGKYLSYYLSDQKKLISADMRAEFWSQKHLTFDPFTDKNGKIKAY